MNNPNPLIPQGSLLEQQAQSKPHLRIALCIVAVHLVFLGGLLIQGCKRDEQSGAKAPLRTNEYALGPLDTNALYGTNLPGASTNEPLTPFVAPLPQVNTNPPPVELPVTPAVQEYTVAAGDSFYTIGRKFHVTANAIAKANPGVESTRLRVGQKLQIPAPPSAPTPIGPSGASDTYVVKTGDTLTKIAREHGTTVSALRELNGLQTDRINIGQKLKLPAKSAAPEPPTGSSATTTGTPVKQ